MGTDVFLAALRIGLSLFRSASVVLLYSLSTYISRVRNFLLLYTWSASAFFTKATEMGHPLIGLYLPRRAVDTISSFFAFSSFSSSVSPGNTFASTMSSFSCHGPASSSLDSSTPLMIKLFSRSLSSMLTSFCFKVKFSCSTFTTLLFS